MTVAVKVRGVVREQVLQAIDEHGGDDVRVVDLLPATRDRGKQIEPS
jgi:hypothetical protein